MAGWKICRSIPTDDVPLPGAIYRAVADRPVKGQGGIFVKLPEGSGFLRQISGVAPGQRLLVQVTGPAEPGKAMPVTTRLLFKSRFAIVTPDAPGLNISRRIKDEDARADLAALADAGMAGADDRAGPDPAVGLRRGRGPRPSPKTSPRCAAWPRRCWPI